MTQHPPLYYILAGGVLAAPGVKDLVWDQSLLLVRLLGALFAAPLVWLSWNGIATLTRSRRFGAVAAFVPFGVPEIAQTMGVTTNDSLVILMAWLTTWVAIKVFVGDRRPRARGPRRGLRSRMPREGHDAAVRAPRRPRPLLRREPARAVGSPAARDGVAPRCGARLRRLVVDSQPDRLRQSAALRA